MGVRALRPQWPRGIGLCRASPHIRFTKQRVMTLSLSPACSLQCPGMRSYAAAMKEVGVADRQQTGRWLNNRVENSHLPFRLQERAMQRFRRMRSLQMFAAVHASVFNHFNTERSLSSSANFKLNRATALAEWRGLCAA